MVPDRVRPGPFDKAKDVKFRRSIVHDEETVALCFYASHNNLQYYVSISGLGKVEINTAGEIFPRLL